MLVVGRLVNLLMLVSWMYRSGLCDDSMLDLDKLLESSQRSMLSD